MGSLAAAMERARLVSSDNKYPADLSSLDIEFADVNGTPVSGSSWSTKNFTITHTPGTTASGGMVQAERAGTGNEGYTLTRYYLTGKVVCADGSNGAGICASLGLETETPSTPSNP